MSKNGKEKHQFEIIGDESLEKRKQLAELKHAFLKRDSSVNYQGILKLRNTNSAFVICYQKLGTLTISK